MKGIVCLRKYYRDHFTQTKAILNLLEGTVNIVSFYCEFLLWHYGERQATNVLEQNSA